MFKNNTFYHGTTRKLIIAFASLFSNLYVQRKDGDIINNVKVPLAYESQKKYLARLIKDTAKNRQVPRMGFIMNGLEMDTTRAGNQMNELQFKNDTDSSFALYSPIPYNFNFSLDIYVDYMDDGLQIIEQILPYFQPDFNMVIEEIPELNIIRDIPIVMGAVAMTDEFEGEFGEHRIVNWTIDFIMKGWVYPPIRDGKVIKEIIANYKFQNEDGQFDLANSPIIEQVKHSVDPLSAGVNDVWTVKTEVGDPSSLSETNWPD